MAINLKFDLMGNPEPPSIVLANRNGNKLGQGKENVKEFNGECKTAIKELAEEMGGEVRINEDYDQGFEIEVSIGK